MAQQTQQANSIVAANTVASFMQQLRNIQNGVNAFLLTYNDQNYATVLESMPTFVFNANGSPGGYDLTAGSGTVAVTSGSTAVAFSTSQSGLAGTYIAITGDSSNGLYLVLTGSGTSWVLASAYGGASNGTASWGTSNPNNAHPIALPIGQPLNMAYDNILTAVGCLQNFQSYMTGVAISSQANTPQKFADLLNS